VNIRESVLVALGYLIYKVIFWRNFKVGMAALVIGLFSWAQCNLSQWEFSANILGRIHIQGLRLPDVIERQRITFEYPAAEPVSDNAVAEPLTRQRFKLLS
jgi:hypothetical protein